MSTGISEIFVISKLSLDWVSRMVFVMQFGLFRKKRGVSLLENHQEMASRYHLRQCRDFYVYELQNIEREIARLGGITQFQTLKQAGGSLGSFSICLAGKSIYWTRFES